MISNPPKFNVESSLQKIVGLKRGTRIEVLEAFWEYVKNEKLQDIENKEIINADDRIRNVFLLFYLRHLKLISLLLLQSIIELGNCSHQ